MQINIFHLYPDLLNLYGDLGNINALEKRLKWRGFDVCVSNVENELKDLENCHILYLGGGGEREEAEVFEKLSPVKEQLKNYAENGGVILATCGGFELLGKLGVLDIEIATAEKRFSGNVILNCILDGQSFNLAGFENHSSLVDIKNNAPLGKVISENAKQTEGVVYKNVFATHLHGPLLPKNPILCDIIIARALKENVVNLKPLDDSFEQIALEEIEKRVIHNC